MCRACVHYLTCTIILYQYVEDGHLGEEMRPHALLVLHEVAHHDHVICSGHAQVFILHHEHESTHDLRDRTVRHVSPNASLNPSKAKKQHRMTVHHGVSLRSRICSVATAG